MLLPMLVAWAVPALGADAPLASVANDADIVIRFKAPQDTIEKVAVLANKVTPGLDVMVRGNAPSIGLAISNPTLAGVDQKSDWYVVVYARADQEPAVVFAVPATDADAMQKALPEKMTALAKDGFVFYAEDQAAVEKFKTGPTSANKSIVTEMDAKAKTVFDAGDLSIFVNVNHLTQVYADQIEQAKDKAAQQLNELQFNAPQVPNFDMSRIADLYSEMLTAGFQGLEDADSCTIAMVVDDGGITFEDYLDFAEGSSAAGWLAGQTTSEMQLASKLPTDAAMYFGLSGDVSRMYDWAMSFADVMAPQDEAGKQKLAALKEEMKGLKYGSMVGSFGLGDAAAGMIRSVNIVEVTPAAKIRELTRQSSELMKAVEIEGNPIKQSIEIAADAETYGAHKADVMTVRQEIDPAQDPTGGMMLMFQQAMFGPEGMQTRMVYLADKYIQSMGGGKQAMEDALERLEASDANDLGKHRGGLIPKPNMLFLMDLPGLVAQGLKAASTAPNLPIPLNPQQVNALRPARSFIGFTLAAEPNALRAKTRIPVEQVQGIMQVVMFFQQMRGQGGQF